MKVFFGDCLGDWALFYSAVQGASGSPFMHTHPVCEADVGAAMSAFALNVTIQLWDP